MSKRKIVGDVLNAASLGNTFQQLQLIEALNEILHEVVDENLSKHIQIANVSRSSVSIMAEDAEWATRARLASDDILFSLQRHPFLSQQDMMLGELKILVRPIEAKHRIEQKSAERPSKNVGFQMIEDAKNLPDGLARAMKRLAGKAK